MNDQQRMTTFREQLQQTDGLDERRFARLMQALDRDGKPAGYDERGRLRVAMYDAKSYDIASFEQQNQGRLAIRPIEASLGESTVDAAEGCTVACLFVNDRCDAAVVAGLAARGVKLVALRCAGFNNVDLAACEQHELDVVRVPAYSPYAVAEHTVALMLMLNRHLHLAYQRNRAGYFVLEGLTGFDMRGKTVGVVGGGKIGRCTIDILLGLGCRVLVFDPQPCEELAARDGVAYSELDTLLRESDIITLHLPLFPETHYLIDAAAIARMKRGVMLINTSRGGLVDTRALIDGLKSGQIGYAGLDVYEEEAGIFFHDVSGKVLSDDVLARLLTFNNVVITSHQAFLTREALSNIAETTLANIAEHQAGRRGAQLTNAVRSPR
ncbi:2-hydroxyacid dehydrogenase [Pirellulimonas nuda]|nr:2-hydroxyacid dehydrogenase [Pirellulimonas nuda]